MPGPKVELDVFQQREQETASRFYARLCEIAKGGWNDLPKHSCHPTSSIGAVAQAIKWAFFDAGMLGVRTEAYSDWRSGKEVLRIRADVPKFHAVAADGGPTEEKNASVYLLSRQFVLRTFHGIVDSEIFDVWMRFAWADRVSDWESHP